MFAVLAGLVVLGVMAAVIVVALRDGGGSDAGRSSDTPISKGPGVVETGEPTKAPERVPVESGAISWSMISEPEVQPMSVDAPDGGSISGQVWSAEEPESSTSGEIGVVFDLGGRGFDMEAGMRGAVANAGGEVIDGPSPLEIGGHQGQMVVGTANSNGIQGYMRVGTVQVGDRVFLVAYLNGTDEIADGQQPFAELVASVRFS